MSQELWTKVDQYLCEQLAPSDAALDNALKSSAEGGLPQINVTANQGKLLQILAQIQGAKNILEIGTLGGYSTIWLARALPKDGRLISLEFEEKNAKVARANIDRAGLSNVVEVRIGRAVDLLPVIEKEKRGPFDLVFVDADKPSNPDYFKWALKLTRKGSLIIIDNVVRDGKVADAGNKDAGVIGTRKALEMIRAEPRVSATAIQTVGSKGYDGFAIARVIGD